MNDGSAKQQIVEKIRDSSNILVTVNANPSVDELSAALGLTVMLNKMNKHATAVFSGDIPPAITFLDPEKTFENTVDSLRDFIIALDKEKADHLRYKVEGDVVKIFITPYRTTIDDKDLEFSQGDYNVELVLALGVQKQEDLDKALEAHGRIFHDATVASLNVGNDQGKLGSLSWNEANASSFSEMLVSLSDSLKSDKPLLDEQISTAFLTGIVAATDRFSNAQTSSKVMTIAAQLMAAGANQQLIAAKLEEAHEITGPGTPGTSGQPQNNDGSTNLTEDTPSKVKKDAEKKPATEAPSSKKKDKDGELSISHEKQGSLDEVARQTAAEQQVAATKRAEEELAEHTELTKFSTPKTAEQALEEELAKVAKPADSTLSVADLQKDLAAAASDVDEAASQQPASVELPPIAPLHDAESEEPRLGGTLNATTEQAADDKRREEASSRNHTILSHGGSGYVGSASQPAYSSALNSTVDASLQEQKPLQDMMAEQTAPTAPAATIQPSPGMTLAQLDLENRTPHEEARSAIDDAFAAQSVTPPLGPIGSETSLFTTPAASNPASVVPPMPDFSTLPPLPGQPEFGATIPTGRNAVSAQPTSQLPPSFQQPVQPIAADPGQFKIPGQQ